MMNKAILREVYLQICALILWIVIYGVFPIVVISLAAYLMSL